MNRESFTIDEKKYPIGWRFNSTECILSSEEKKRIIFLDEDESSRFWHMIFPFDHLMKMPPMFCSVTEKIDLDFKNSKQSSFFFENKLAGHSSVFFFWGKIASAIVPVDIFIKSWNDFFYPSDETSILFIASKNRMIFSYNETFFYADILSNLNSRIIDG